NTNQVSAMNALCCVALVAAGALAAGGAVAEDLPIKAPPTAVVTSSNQVYMWIDGTWLPISGAPVSSPSTPVADLTRGAIGYVFPDGTLAPVFGSTVRPELGASSARGDVPPFFGIAHGQTTVNGVTLGTCAVCPVQAASAYNGWQTSVKTTGDFKIQALTLSPSISLFSGRNHQDFAPAAPYASSALDWADVGAKLGLDAKVDLAKTLSFGVGGNLGVARRDTSLLANEVLSTPGYATAPL